ncbi:hypothetical protein ACP26L_16915 [Paenibacillus sp. S-38]|uniref:hypothetical protein n=1 Tax=Paenibacillus sp. S-38 TaxID=3416710 RepID=UPI003CF2E31B
MTAEDEKQKQEKFIEAYLRERGGILPGNEQQAETAALQAFRRLEQWVREARSRRQSSDS